MQKLKRSVFVKLIAILLFVVMLCPVQVFAAGSRASYYISTYSGYIYIAAWGKVQVWFEVEGTNVMDEIGALEIQLYESTDNANWTWVKTFGYTNNSGMMEYNDYIHSGHVEHTGIYGHYYKASVCIWAGKDGAGDSRTFWTSPKKATMLIG